MKKGKMIYLFPLAALLLSGCSWSEIKSSIGDSWVGQHILHPIYDPVKGWISGDDKKEEQKPCEHVDKNHDGVCDLCGASGLEIKHVDDNHDHKCDVCGAVISQCADENHDHACDICGAELTKHADEDNDFKCDICGVELKLDHVELDTSKAKLAYSLGEEFSSAGVKVIAVSEIGSKKELSATFSEPDMSTVGEKTVTVTYGEGENEKFEYTITVSFWSEEDLEVLSVVSLSGYAPLPYLPNHNMRVEYELEDDYYIVSWNIAADAVGAEDYLEYISMLKAYSGSATIDDDDVSFALAEVSGNFEGYHDLSDVTVFRLTPSSIYNNREVRYFAFDEYFVLGLTEEGNLVVESRKINAMLDGYFFDTDLADGYYGFPAKVNYYIEYLPDVIQFYYSELSYNAFVYPEMNENTEIVPMNLASMYPLDESLDEYDLAWMVECDYSTEAEYNKFIDSLLQAGYEPVVNGEGEDSYTSYVLEDKFYGRLEYIAKFSSYSYEDESGKTVEVPYILFEFYYNAPESYTNHLSPMADAIVEGLFGGAGIYYDDLYEDFGVVVGYGEVSAENYESGFDVAEDLARAFLNIGFEVYDPIELVEPEEEQEPASDETGPLDDETGPLDDETGPLNEEEEEEEEEVPYYYFSVVREDYFVEFYVDAAPSVYDEADEESEEEPLFSTYSVEFIVSDGGEVELPKGEVELQAIYEAFDGYKPLIGVDYFIDEVEAGEDQSYTSTALSKVDEEASDEGRQAFAEGLAELLPESYELVSSELDEELGAWAVQFQDVDRGFIVDIVVAAFEGKGYSYQFRVTEHRFTTPLSVITDFVVAATGAEPSEGAIVEADGKYSYESTVTGEFESIEAASASFASNLSDKFELASSEAGSVEGSWVQVYEYVDAKIRATVSLVAGEEGFSASITTEFIYPELPFEDILAFYEAVGIEGVVVPGYELHDVDAEFEISTDYPGYLDLYLYGTTHDEMEAYKDALVGKGWVVVGEADGDYRLQFGETNVYVDLVDYLAYFDYVNVSFWYKATTADQVANLFNEGLADYGLAAEYYDIEDVFTGWYLGVGFGAAADDSEATLKKGCQTLAQFLPINSLWLYSEEYTAATETEDADYSMVYFNEDFTVAVEIYSYVDSETGNLVADIYIYDIAE